MSLAALERIYVGHEQADIACLTADGIRYRCKVYLSRATWAIEAICHRIELSGDVVEIFHNVVARASSAVISDTNGMPLDSPKILPSGTTFVVHWLQATDIIEPETNVFVPNWSLNRATMDMTNFSITSWTDRGAVGVYEPHALYDHHPIVGHDDAFVVARLTDLNVITVQRWNEADGYDWVDQVWTETPGSQDVAPHVLAVFAHESDNDVVITYERDTVGTLMSLRIDADSGNNEAGPVEVFPAFRAAAASPGEIDSWVQVTHARTAANRVAVVAEVLSARNFAGFSSYVSLGWVHHVCYRLINSDSTARVGNEHWCANLHLMSRAWTYANGTAANGSTPDLYVCVGYRSIVEAEEWSQAYAFACNLDLALWQTVSDGAGLRPRPIATYWTLGIPDVRASGWHPNSIEGAQPDVHIGGPTKRMNHLSFASAAALEGPEVKTRTVALVAFSTIRTVSDTNSVTSAVLQTVAPERAIVGDWTIYLEDPQTLYRDATDPTQPTANFAYPYSRAMHQCCPAGKGMFISGGTPQIYDGRQVVECGYPWKPEIIFADATTGGELTSGVSYSYYAQYSWPDGAGQVQRSGASNLVTVELGGSDTAVDLRIRCCNISLKDADAFYGLTPPIAIELFRVVAGIAYRVFGSADSPYRPSDTPINDPEIFLGVMPVFDGLADAALILQGNGPFQVGTSTVFPATQSEGGNPNPCTLPAMTCCANFLNRVWCASAIDPAVVWYSDDISPVGEDFYQQPIFTPVQTFRIGEIGEITGMAEMGSTLWIFTRSSIYALRAQDAGAGLLTVQADKVHGDTGCVDPRTIVLFYGGIGFQSQRGYEILGRDGQLAYGAQSRTRDAAQLTGGAAIEDDLRECGNIRAAAAIENDHLILLVGNGEPVTTQTWTGTITTDVGGAPAGTWTIDGLSQPVSFSTVASFTVGTSLASSLESEIDDLIDADAPNTLQFQVADVSSPGATVVIELQPGETATLTGTAPVGGGLNAINFALTETIETQPWVLAYNTYFQQWSRWELPQISATTRLAEVVGGVTWRGDGGSLHAVLCQGGLLIQRRPDDALAYADATSVADVGIPLDLTWAWWHLAGVVGAQRLWDIQIQTQRFNQAPLFATLEYDREGDYDGQQLQPTAYEWPRTGETVTPNRLSVKPRYQRAGAHRLRLYETSGVTTARTFVVRAMTLIAGVESSHAKTRPALRGEV